MTIALWCVLVAGLLPLVSIPVAKLGKGYDNKNPRAWLAQQEGLRARAHAAHLNGHEAFPLFAAAVIIAHVRSTDAGTVTALAVTFIAARLLYIALYLADLDKLRSLVWFVGLGCSVALFFV